MKLDAWIASIGAVAGDRACPIDTFRAGVLPDPADGIDDVELAVLASFVGRSEAFYDLGCGNAGAQELERPTRIERVDERLCAERAGAAFGMRTQRADGEEPRRDGDAERAARIARNDRPGHGRGS